MNRRIITTTLAAFFALSVLAQPALKLNIEECRKLAIENNKTLKIASEKERKAYYQKREALMQYFPKLSASGSYLHFSENLHLISKEAIPQSINLPPNLGIPSITIPEEVREGIYKATEIDMSGFWSLGLTLTQPIFAGGRIIALNDIRSYAEKLAASMKETSMTEVLVEVDETYWQVVSLANKTKLAQSYVDLLAKIDSDIQAMLDEGLATKADRLSVNVKLNQAEITLTKANNGLSISKMLLCQIIGIDITDHISLTDENLDTTQLYNEQITSHDIATAIENRPEIKSLGWASKIYKKQEIIARAEFLPTIGMQAGYSWGKPNLQNGVQNSFKGMWNIGVSVGVPLNFISSSAKLKSAKSESLIHQYQVEEAKDKIKLQISQSSHKLSEAYKTLRSTNKNSAKADENLQYANVGFEEGVIPASDVLAAHAAWVAAYSEVIDSQIDVKLCLLYLDKALGKKIY